MEVRPQSRYKLRRLTKRGPEVKIFLTAELESDPLTNFLSERRNLLEVVATQMYDSVWPEWRNHRVLQISLRLIGEEQMAKINNEYRQVDASTDVLTFPLFEENGSFNPPSGLMPLPLGDILLCPAVIHTNAKEHAVSEESEATLVIFHGMLHLLAWDHDTLGRQEKMWEVQERFRDLFLRHLNDNIEATEEKH